ncbi:hypothetical protein GGR57DRAFT_500409 [Xylariaceae sp. FL1272]|nr:hypothetical protein GGR57DRAFT_500409 [Xylariaceae sp. FL1272]
MPSEFQRMPFASVLLRTGCLLQPGASSQISWHSSVSQPGERECESELALDKPTSKTNHKLLLPVSSQMTQNNPLYLVKLDAMAGWDKKTRKHRRLMTKNAPPGTPTVVTHKHLLTNLLNHQDNNYVLCAASISHTDIGGE